MFTSELGLENPFPGFDSCFPPWDSVEPLFLFDAPFPDQVDEQVAMFLPAEQTQEPITSSSGSDISISDPITPNSDSSELNQNRSNHLSSINSHETILLASIINDERKRRRTESNRESARRSRMRQKKHLENLGTQVNRKKRENFEIMKQLKFVVSRNEAVCRENEQLRLEAAKLRQRLWEIRQVLLVRRLQHHFIPNAWRNKLTSINGGTLPNHPLII
ncbi:ocs element-binding factor 1-like [Dorcoceras hygrometricum]|uniref:Ocs element-binding factor 1-like n=1 Tax=Dorcoceras hygrometricum TaxID=472368 RepID=A0A2Z7ATE5_9LAMI|nr:ocs element-binding factor 1-like [Dorcoceras hygrometricum]